MAKQNTKEKSLTVELPSTVLDIKKNIKPDAFKELGSGGMGGVVKDILQEKELDRLKKRAVDIGVKAYDLSLALQKGYHLIKEGLNEQHLPVGDTMEFTVQKTFTPAQSKLLKETVEFNNEFVTAVDKAFAATTEESWEAVENKFKTANTIIKKIEDLTNKKVAK